jgi:hypothetical protein
VSDKNEPKLISKVIRNLLWEKPRKRRTGLLTRYYVLLKPVELLIFGIFYEFFQDLFLNKKFEKYYSNKPLDLKVLKN